MVRENRVLILVNERDLELWLRALVLSLDQDAPITLAPSRAAALRSARGVSLALVGLAGLAPEKLDKWITQLEHRAPGASVVIVGHELAHDRKSAAKKIAKKRYYLSSFDLEAARALLSKLL